MSRIDAIFFDLDGTLTDPKVGITRCIRDALGAVGVLYGYGSRHELEVAGAQLLISRPEEIVDILDAWPRPTGISTVAPPDACHGRSPD